MKWALFVLLSLNLVVAGVQWVNMREAKELPVYKEVVGSQGIELLQEIRQKSLVVIEGEGKRCLLMGPTKEKVLADEMYAALNAEGILAELVIQKIDKAPGYWVYYDRFEGEGERDKQLAEFKLRGIDSFIIRKGDLAGAISLGVFENIDSTRRLKKKMAKLGYEVQFDDIEKSELEYWILLPLSSMTENRIKVEQIFAPIKKLQEMREIFCKSVASEKQFT